MKKNQYSQPQPVNTVTPSPDRENMDEVDRIVCEVIKKYHQECRRKPMVVSRAVAKALEVSFGAAYVATAGGAGCDD